MSNGASGPLPVSGIRNSVVFFGRRCRLSAGPLAALLEAGVDVGAVVTPGRAHPGRPTPPVRQVAPRTSRSGPRMAGEARQHSLDEVAASSGVPLLEVAGLRHPEVFRAVAALEPAIFAVSCFPWRLPQALLQMPRLVALNAHPSLLPRHRGPDPLFWTYRALEQVSGVSIHLMTETLDDGDVVAQDALDVPPGQPGDVLESRCALLSGTLLTGAVRAARSGRLRPVPQDPRLAAYEGWPDARDLRVDPGWTAAESRHFVSGVIPLGYTPTIEVDGVEYPVIGVPPLENNGTGSAASVGRDVALTRRDGPLAVRVGVPRI